MDESDFLEAVLASDVNRVVLERAPSLGVPDWWLTGGAVFQAVWNQIDGRDPDAGVLDRNLFYFDPSDLTWEAEDTVIRRAAALFTDLPSPVQVRNQARVHLWFESRFGVTTQPFTSSRDAINHFASTTCCYGVTRGTGGLEVHAPHGFADLAAARVRPNPWPRHPRGLRDQDRPVDPRVANPDRRALARRPPLSLTGQPTPGHPPHRSASGTCPRCFGRRSGGASPPAQLQNKAMARKPSATESAPGGLVSLGWCGSW